MHMFCDTMHFVEFTVCFHGYFWQDVGGVSPRWVEEMSAQTSKVEKVRPFVCYGEGGCRLVVIGHTCAVCVLQGGYRYAPTPPCTHARPDLRMEDVCMHTM